MSRSRALLLSVVVIAVALSAPAPQAQDDAEIAALTQKIDALEKRIATMERNLTQQLRAIERAVARGGGGGANAALEAFDRAFPRTEGPPPGPKTKLPPGSLSRDPLPPAGGHHPPPIQEATSRSTGKD